MERLDQTELELSERENETFRRLHLLVRRGYVAKLNYDVVLDAIFLDHLGEGPNLILYPSGMIVATSFQRDVKIEFRDDADPDRIYNFTRDDALAFDKFLTMVKPPTWRQRTAPDREKYIWTPAASVGCLAVCIGAGALLSKALRAIWSAL